MMSILIFDDPIGLQKFKDRIRIVKTDGLPDFSVLNFVQEIKNPLRWSIRIS